jgi:hypothetical protein
VRRGTPRPTDEQAAVVEAFGAGDDLVIEAGAGTGKTSTLAMLTESAPARRGIYLAYNRSAADDAKQRFPASVECLTAHALAFRAVGRSYARRLRAPRQTSHQAAQILGLQPFRLSKDLVVGPNVLARLALGAVRRFCWSADDHILPQHVPVWDLRIPSLPEGPAAVQGAIVQAVLPIAEQAWRDLTSAEGQLRFEHDHYLKVWALSRPRIRADYLLLDEAQDANPVIEEVVGQQDHLQRVLVGDRQQQIYAWRGAVDAMSRFRGRRLVLSQSFRFGPAIAEEANKWLAALGAGLRLSGLGGPSQVARLAQPDAILCRTNASCVQQIMDAFDAGRRPALVGGGEGIRRFAVAAIKLKAGIPCEHPELVLFRSWEELQEFVEQEEAGSDLKVFVDLVDRHGPTTLIDLVDQLVDERHADVIVSTAHRAKGREWATVKLGAIAQERRDREAGRPLPPSDTDARLAYVAVTRARAVLDRGPMGWIDPRGVESPGFSRGEEVKLPTTREPAGSASGPRCDGCGRLLEEVGGAVVWNDNGRFCADCEEIGLRWRPAGGAG